MSSDAPAVAGLPPVRRNRAGHRLLRNAWGLLLLVALAPLLAWFSPLVLLFLLWPVLVALNPLQPPPTGMTRTRVVGDAILLLLFCLPLLGLLRGAQIGPWLSWPPVIEFANRMLQPGVEAWGQHFIPAFDLVLGTVGALVAVGFALQDTAWRAINARRARSLPLSRIADLGPGMVRVHGQARSLYDPESPILYYLQASEAGGEARAQHNTFHLEDDSGRVVVETAGACFSDEQAVDGEHLGMFDYLRAVAGILDTRCSEIVLPLHERVADDGRLEWMLRQGDPVYLLGVAQRRFGSDSAEGELVIRPQAHLFGGHFHQFFFLTNGDERLPRGYFRHGLAYAWLYALVTSAFCGWLAWIGFIGIWQFEQTYGYRYNAPVDATFEQEAIPLTERRAQVPGFGLISVAEMLAATREADTGQLMHLLTGLESLQAHELVVPLLQDMVEQDDDPARRHIAEGKLRLWGEVVPQARSHFAALYLGGERVPLDNRTAEELQAIASHLLASCRDGVRGEAAWRTRNKLTEADRLFFRFAEPLALQHAGESFHARNAGLTLGADGRPGRMFVYTERDFRLVSACNPDFTRALWCHHALKQPLGRQRPAYCRR